MCASNRDPLIETNPQGVSEGEGAMENDRLSSTSEAAAANRGVHQLLDDEPKILVDPIALRLVEMPKDIDANVEDSKPVFKQPPSRLVALGRYAEDCLAAAGIAGAKLLMANDAPAASPAAGDSFLTICLAAVIPVAVTSPRETSHH
jgi:hypothetical protein